MSVAFAANKQIPEEGVGFCYDRSGQVANFSWPGTSGCRSYRSFAWTNEFTAGTAPGRLSVSRKEYNHIFSAGDIVGGERGAFDCALCGEPLAAIEAEGPSVRGCL